MRNTGKMGQVIDEPSSLSAPITQEVVEGYVRLDKVCTSAATAQDVMFNNVRYSITLGFPRLHEMDGFKVVKDRTKKIAIVGGGPSLTSNLDALREFDTIIACGSVHDYLIKNGITPTYATACDPDPIMANYYRNSNISTTYLIATACDKKVFETLKGKNIYLWHCFSDAGAEEFKKIEPDYQAIGGGCTVGLRSISIALMLGYSNLHFFGFDSSLAENDRTHAYEYTDESEKAGLGNTYSLRLGMDGPDKKVFRVAGYQLAQAHHFKLFYEVYHGLFTPTFHGDGLLPDLVEYLKADLGKNERVST